MTASFASTGITGLIGALAGGQPLVLYGQTGPVQLIYIYLAEYCRNSGGGVTFPGVVAWTGIWAFCLHVLVALLNVSQQERGKANVNSQFSTWKTISKLTPSTRPVSKVV